MPLKTMKGKPRCYCFWWSRVVLYSILVLSNVALGWTIHSDRESLTDRRTQVFWESAPFKTAESVVLRVLTEPFPGPLMEQQTAENTIFSRLYQGQLQAHEHLTPDLQEKTNTPSSKKKTFRLDLAYAGQHFCGWQRQASDISSVQAAVEDSLSEFYSGTASSPNVRVSGRTDAGVHAVGQIARLQLRGTSNVTRDDIFETLEAASAAVNYTWRCLAVTRASDKFHPTFDCQARSYAYVIDANALSALCRSFGRGESMRSSDGGEIQLENTVLLLDTLLQSLEGKELDYFAFSYGKVKTQSTLCCLVHARARLLAGQASAVTIELTGNRFLRRMVRILVSTALQLVVSGMVENNIATLIDMCAAGDRSLTAKAAPPGGLIKVGASMV